jgi:hypothetical protein
MLSESSWGITLGAWPLADWESAGRRRAKALQRLVGARLLSLEIDERSPASVLCFSRNITLRTANMAGSRNQRPHWLLRRAKGDWPLVSLPGTAYRWRLEDRGIRPLG